MKSSHFGTPPSQTEIDGLLSYWRTSLADEDILGGRDGDQLSVDLNEVGTGQIGADLASQLRRQWMTILENAKSERTSIDFAKEQEPTLVPVVLLSHGLSPKYDHASIVGDRNPVVSFAMVVPAILDPNDALRPDPENLPWIRREFLAPTASDSEEIPIVGTVHDFDDWLGRNSATLTDWTALVEWCGRMWAAVTHGSLPDSFVEIDADRIYASEATRGMGRHILKLYDALLADPQHYPPLLTGMCAGRTAEAFSRSHCLRQIDATRGYMGAVFGLAASQSDAVAVMTLLKDGEVLAVNGPPGTGKTTLLQSVIATETVSRALSGDDPAIIVGCSTNNQAVVNINRAMNRVLAENHSGETFAWARRWVPDASTYGLYLPSADKADDAEANGFAVAVHKSGGNWARFPDREVDPSYVDRALSCWIAGFRDAYGCDGTVPKDGFARIRDDLKRLLAQVQAAGDTVRRWDRIEQWWRELAGEKGPEAFIARQATQSRHREAAAVAALEMQVRDGRAVRAAHEAALSGFRKDYDDAAKLATEISRRFEAATLLRSNLQAAGAPRGFFELALTVLPGTRRFAEALQHKRRLEALKPEDKILFQAELDNRDGSAWDRRTKEIVADVKRDLLRAQEMRKGAEAKRQTAKVARDRAVADAAQAVWRGREVCKNERLTNQQRLANWNRQLGDLHSMRNEIRSVYEALRRRPAIQYADAEAAADAPDWLAVVDRTLDVSIRHEMFQKAMILGRQVDHRSTEPVPRPDIAV